MAATSASKKKEKSNGCAKFALKIFYKKNNI
jgi:hypothetical protein